MSRFILDADVFIDAKNKYYAFLICPGFWDSLIHHYNAEVVYSIDKVKDELLEGYEGEKKSEEEGKGKIEDLKKWIKKDLPSGFFLSTNDQSVVKAYSEMMDWIWNHEQYNNEAENEKFADGADGWLVAFAMANKMTVVTHETPIKGMNSRKIKIPDVCNHFNVPCINPFELLQELKVVYELKK